MGLRCKGRKTAESSIDYSLASQLARDPLTADDHTCGALLRQESTDVSDSRTPIIFIQKQRQERLVSFAQGKVGHLVHDEVMRMIFRIDSTHCCGLQDLR